MRKHAKDLLLQTMRDGHSTHALKSGASADLKLLVFHMRHMAPGLLNPRPGLSGGARGALTPRDNEVFRV